MTSNYHCEGKYYVLALALAEPQLISQQLNATILAWFQTNLKQHFTTQIRVDIDEQNNTLFCSFDATDAELLTGLYEFLHTLYYTDDFLTLWAQRTNQQLPAPIFYCGCGIGELHNLRMQTLTLTGSAIEHAQRALRNLVTGRGSVQAYKFARLPIQLAFVSSTDSLANELAALFYLTYEMNLTTLIKQVVYFTSLADKPHSSMSNSIRHQYQVGQLLGKYFQVKSYQLDYQDSVEHSKVSARLSKILRELNHPQINRTKEVIRQVVKQSRNFSS